MTTIAEQIVVNIAARLRDLPEVPADENVRRDHLTPATKDECPLIDIQMGDDLPSGKSSNQCVQTRKLSVDISIQVRDNAPNTAADPIVAAVYKALSPTTPYPGKAIIGDRGVRRGKPEIADDDAHEVIVGVEFTYTCLPWDLTQNADDQT